MNPDYGEWHDYQYRDKYDWYYNDSRLYQRDFYGDRLLELPHLDENYLNKLAESLDVIATEIAIANKGFTVLSRREIVLN